MNNHHQEQALRSSDPGDEVRGIAVTTAGTHDLYADGTLSEPFEPAGEEAEEAPVTAVIYDRNATNSPAYLELRLEACREYAAERGWTIAGEHIDTGDDALHDHIRPALENALHGVRKAAEQPTENRAVLLVYNDGRLSHEIMTRARWRYRVEMTGGTLATVQ